VDKRILHYAGRFFKHQRANGERGLQHPLTCKKTVDERADYVVFNGKDGALTGASQITANVGGNSNVSFVLAT